jgi:uncharacterized protein (DUF1697 family)
MAGYAAFFRGINVGGKNIVKMKDLVKLFTDLGFEKVKSYLQSGNVVFESEEAEAEMKKRIRTAFTDRFGFESVVILRSGKEITDLIDAMPYTEKEIQAARETDLQAKHLYVFLLETEPDMQLVDRAVKHAEGTDLLHCGKRELFLLCDQSIRLSKLARETAKLFDTATARNWKTLCSIQKMLIT